MGDYDQRPTTAVGILDERLTYLRRRKSDLVEERAEMVKGIASIDGKDRDLDQDIGRFMHAISVLKKDETND